MPLGNPLGYLMGGMGGTNMMNKMKPGMSPMINQGMMNQSGPFAGAGMKGGGVLSSMVPQLGGGMNPMQSPMMNNRQGMMNRRPNRLR